MIKENLKWQGFGYQLFFMMLKDHSDIEITKEGVYHFENKLGDVTFSEECFFDTYEEAEDDFDNEKVRLEEEYGENILILVSQSYIYYSS